MCGIIGGYNYKSITAGLDAIEHRGPDARDVKKINSVTFGHVRLSIMDTSSLSNQPMTIGDTTIVYNGSIWNFRQVREYLIQKYNLSFKTDGDTEVVASLIDKEDLSGIEKLQGMFAIAWTKGDGDITLVRDRFCETPIHYSHLESSFFP